MSLRRFPRALALAAAAFGAATPALASDPFLTVLPAAEALKAPAQQHAQLSRDEALEALRARGVAFAEVPAAEAPGVLAPVRLTGPVGGVWFRSSDPESARRRSRYEILDARLALTLADWAELLRHHDVEEVRHFGLYRPEPPTVANLRRKKRKGAPAAPAAPTTPGGPSAGQATSRHPAGLAIDVAAFRKRDGGWLRVADQFSGRVGARTCGAGAPRPPSFDARELRSIVCEAADAKVFTYVLTPNYNAAHRDHFHLEVKGGVPWVLVH
ncbi:MAG TPA: extensin family protein [Polyangiaceae bacterium]|nr:extensin family protein [Polyangiaceae bacterium]